MGGGLTRAAGQISETEIERGSQRPRVASGRRWGSARTDWLACTTHEIHETHTSDSKMRPSQQKEDSVTSESHFEGTSVTRTNRGQYSLASRATCQKSNALTT
jgi:hypothetical protein